MADTAENDKWVKQFERVIGEDENHRHCSRCGKLVRVKPSMYALWAQGFYLCGPCFITRTEENTVNG